MKNINELATKLLKEQEDFLIASLEADTENPSAIDTIESVKELGLDSYSMGADVYEAIDYAIGYADAIRDIQREVNQ